MHLVTSGDGTAGQEVAVPISDATARFVPGCIKAQALPAAAPAGRDALHVPPEVEQACAREIHRRRWKPAEAQEAPTSPPSESGTKHLCAYRPDPVLPGAGEESQAGLRSFSVT